MKDLFPGYYKKTPKEIDEIWKNCVLVFDANILINLYRYSESTKDILIKIIEKFESKIWLPHQVALEYNRNRFSEILNQQTIYKELIKSIEQIKSGLNSNSKHPVLTKNVYNELELVFDKVNKEANESIKKYDDYFKIDPIYNKLSSLFEGKISGAYNETDLKKIYKEGEVRYGLKIPPGYLDATSKSDDRKYGDLVLWKQIIDKAKIDKSPIVFVSDDGKDDWWWKIKGGKTLGPRPELVDEIKKEAGVDFHVYSTESFLKFGQKYFSMKVSTNAFEEILATKQTEEGLINDFDISKLNVYENALIQNQIQNLEYEVGELTNVLNSLINEQNELNKVAQESIEVEQRKFELKLKQMNIESKLKSVNHELDLMINHGYKTILNRRILRGRSNYIKAYWENSVNN